MDNEKFQDLVLQQLQVLTYGQKELQKDVQFLQKDVLILKDGQEKLRKDVEILKSGQEKLQKDVTGIKKELGYVWDDIKKIDVRLSGQEEELVILKQLK